MEGGREGGREEGREAGRKGGRKGGREGGRARTSGGSCSRPNGCIWNPPTAPLPPP